MRYHFQGEPISYSSLDELLSKTPKTMNPSSEVVAIKIKNPLYWLLGGSLIVGIIVVLVLLALGVLSPKPTETPTVTSPVITTTPTPISTPTDEPTFTPTYAPAFTPTYAPTFTPTYAPTFTPTFTPTNAPTNVQLPNGSYPRFSFSELGELIICVIYKNCVI